MQVICEHGGMGIIFAAHGSRWDTSAPFKGQPAIQHTMVLAKACSINAQNYHGLRLPNMQEQQVGLLLPHLMQRCWQLRP